MTELRRLGKRFVAVLVFSVILAFLLATAWREGTLVVDAVYTLSDLTFGALAVGTPIQLFASAALGTYFAVLLLFAVDWRKRYNGALLLVGSLVGIWWLAGAGLLVDNIPLTRPNALSFLGSLFAVYVVGYFGLGEPAADKVVVEDPEGDIKVANRGPTSGVLPEVEISGVSYLVFALLGGMAVVGLVQVLIAPPLSTFDLLGAVSTAGFLYVLMVFITYETGFSVALVGPGQSGKTWALVGLYSAFRERADVMTKRTKDFAEIYDPVDRMTEGQGFGVVGETEDYDNVGFYIAVGEMFPMKARFNTRDFEGEWLGSIADAFREQGRLGLQLRFAWAWLVLSLGDRLGQDDDSEYERWMAIREIYTSNLVMMVVDMKKVVEGDDAYEQQMETIAERLDGKLTSETEVLVVATKCDVVLEDYWEEVGTLPGDQDIETFFYQSEDTSATSFREYITDLATERGTIDDLVGYSNYNYVFPVFYETTEHPESGEPVPVLEGTGGPPESVGFDRLASVLELEARDDARL